MIFYRYYNCSYSCFRFLVSYSMLLISLFSRSSTNNLLNCLPDITLALKSSIESSYVSGPSQAISWVFIAIIFFTFSTISVNCFIHTPISSSVSFQPSTLSSSRWAVFGLLDVIQAIPLSKMETTPLVELSTLIEELHDALASCIWASIACLFLRNCSFWFERNILVS